MPKPSVFIAIPNTNKVVSPTTSFLFNLSSAYDGNLGLFIPMEVPHDNNRNYIVQEFLKKDGMEWLLMFDSDITPPKTVLDMTQNGKGICSAFICAQRYARVTPLALTYVDERGLEEYKRQFWEKHGAEIERDPINRERVREEMAKAVPGYRYAGHKENELQRVDATGTGCLLIHRSVLERMRDKFAEWPVEKRGWFRFRYDSEGRVTMGEDIDFCEKAKELGEEIWFDARQRCLHRTDIII